MRPLHEGELEGLWSAGIAAADPQPYIDRLVQAARTPSAVEAGIEPSYPFGLAAAICRKFGRLEEALALVDEGIAADLTETPPYQLADRAELLIRLGRPDEGMALLESLRPLLGEDITAASSIVDVLTELGRRELAVEWMTVAIRHRLPGLDELTVGALREFDYLVAVRARVRQELELPPDKLDQLERAAPPEADWDELDDDEPDDDRAATALALMFWPEDEFALVIGRWPDLAEGYGSNWDEHRAGFITAAEKYDGIVPIQVAPGNLAEFLTYCDQQDLDPTAGESRSQYAAEVSRLGRGVSYPPERNAACWCGSGLKYKKCCLYR